MNNSTFITPRSLVGKGTRRDLFGVAATSIAGGLVIGNRSTALASPGRTFGPTEPFSQSGYGWVANHGLSGDAYQQEFENLTGQGFRLLKLSGYSVAGQDFYASIWDLSPGPAWVGMHRVPGSDYQAQFEQLTAQGFRPVVT